MSLVPDKDICCVCDGFIDCGTESSRCRCKYWRCGNCGRTEQNPNKPDSCRTCGNIVFLKLEDNHGA